MRPPLLLAFLALVGNLSVAALPPPAPAAEEEFSLDELDQLDAPGPGEQPRRVTFHVPLEHDYDRRLLVLPALLVLMLAWNVDWKKQAPGPRRKI